MKIHFLVYFVLILVGCATNKPVLPRYMTDMSQPIPETLKIPNAPKTARNIKAFHSINRAMTMTDLVRQCGVPDEHQGSGIYIFIYHLDDGSIVSLALQT